MGITVETLHCILKSNIRLYINYISMKENYKKKNPQV